MSQSGLPNSNFKNQGFSKKNRSLSGVFFSKSGRKSGEFFSKVHEPLDDFLLAKIQAFCLSYGYENFPAFHYITSKIFCCT
jgi:hypothetical protein